MNRKVYAVTCAAVSMFAVVGGNAHASDLDQLERETDGLRRQNAALEARLNELEKKQASQSQTPQAATETVPGVRDFRAAAGNPANIITGDGPLTWNGITFFGTIDAGLGYSAYGMPMNSKFYEGQEIISRFANKPYFGLIPNGLGVSTLGVKGEQEIIPGWSGVFMASTNFDPQSGQLANAPGAIADNQGLNRNNQSLNGDGSRGGQAFNDQLYVGVSSKQFGQLTFGRHRSLGTDLTIAYDPNLSTAFSLIGYTGTYFAGLGNTANSRWDDSIKYRVDVPVNGELTARFGAMYKFIDGSGGSNLGNVGLACTGANAPVAGCAASNLTGIHNFSAHNDAGQISLGGSYKALDIDGLLGYYHQSVAVPAALSATQLGGISTFVANTFTPTNGALSTTTYGNANSGTLAATASDNTGGAIAAKYTWEQFKFYVGWAHVILHNPTDNVGIGAPASQGGYILSSVNNGAFPHARLLDTVWLGAKYAYNPKTDFSVAYYHVNQNAYGFAPNTIGVSNTASNSLATCGLTNYNRVTQTTPRSPTCAGSGNVIAGFVDYHFTKRFDVYAGMMYSALVGGMAAGYYSTFNFAPTAGLKYTF